MTAATPPAAAASASPKDVLALETLAARAWPAREIERCGGWLLRWSEDGTWRTRSVWPNAADTGAPDVDARIARAEAFYRAHGEPARFQVSRAARPSDLDARLAARGYRIETSKSSHVLAGPLEGLLVEETLGAPRGRAEIDERVTADWLGAYHSCVGVAEALLPSRRAVFERIAAPRRHACLRDARGEAVAVCVGVIEEGWLGLYSLGTRPERRRSGAARALLAALASEARGLGAVQAYLQVERDNAAALALYARAGFARHHDYHYRVAPA